MTGKKIHGDTRTHYLYRLWQSIKRRCYNINYNGYKDYGGRGISMYYKWKDDYLMFKFWILNNLGEKPENMTLERINNDKNYEPNNLKWATRAEQSINKRNNKNNTSGYNGVTYYKKTNKWAAKISINSKTINIGYFNSAKDACLNRNKYIIENKLPNRIEELIKELF